MPTDPKNVFSLKGKGLKLHSEDDIEPYLTPLRENADVEEVHLAGNTFGIGASKALADALKDKKKLKIANLDDIFTGRLIEEIPESIDSILKAIVSHPELHTINVSDNAFGIRTVQPLIDFLAEHTPLENLYLNNNGLGPQAGALVGNALKTLAEKKTADNGPTLKLIVCGRNRLERGSMKAWAGMLKCHAEHAKKVGKPGLTHLNIKQNGIREHGISELLQGLVFTESLVSLDFQDNIFTSKDTRKFALVVQSWQKLVELDIGDCYLTTRGLIRLAGGLEKGTGLPALELLKLQYNDIRTTGLDALRKSLAEVPKLRRVELDGNLFSEKDDNLAGIKKELDQRRTAAAEEDDEHDHRWGFDELDGLDDEEGSEEEEESESEAEPESEPEAVEVVADKEAKKADDKVADKKVNELADLLTRTGL